MPERLNWTKAADQTILSMRAAGATWAAIGTALGLSRNTIIERGRRINALGGPAALPKPAREPEDDANRPALPAGHPVSWGLLTDGTLLDGVEYVPPHEPRKPANPEGDEA